MGLGLGNGLVNLFKHWGTGIGRGIGNAADKLWLNADAQKAIRNAVEKKYKPKIDLANRAESRKAKNIKDLEDKLNQSKEELKNAQKDWQDKYDTALADAQKQRQIDIDDYTTRLQGYQNASDAAKANKQSIFDQLSDSEARYDQYKTIFIDVNNGKRYILNPITGSYESLTKFYQQSDPQAIQQLSDMLRGYETRLFDRSNSNRVINAFDKSDIKQYKGKSSFFDSYRDNKISTRNADLRNAENEITKAEDDLTSWQGKKSPKVWSKNDSNKFKTDFEKTNNTLPTEFSFNGQKYSDAASLDKAYTQELGKIQSRQDLYREVASDYTKRRDAEIARSIQDAKDMNKAKVALGGTLGAGALYAGARAMYGKHGTDNTDNTNNGEPDSNFNVKNLPEVQAQLNDEQQSDTASINTGFDPDKADALASASALARASYDEGVEDGNSIASSDDLGNRIAASTGGHTIDDKLFELIKAMQDPYKADAVANYIYSRHGDNPELQRLGWRAWLNKYYGDSLRSMMNIDPSGYKGMHISGGL